MDGPIQNPIYQTNRLESKTSDKYIPLPSVNVINFFESKGFVVDSMQYAKTLSPERQGYQRHLVKFSNPNIKFKGLNSVKPQVLLINSHCGDSSLKLSLGLYRLVCENGMVVSDGIFESIRIRHIGDARRQLETHMPRIVAAMHNIEALVDKFKSIELSGPQALSFALTCARHRLKHLDSAKLSYINLDQVLRVHRPEDKSQDLWTVLNRIQESVIRRGFKYALWSKDKQGIDVVRNAKANGIRAIDRQVDLNKFIFAEALKLAA